MKDTMKKNMKNATVFSTHTKYKIGEVVRHRVYPFRGIVFDVDPEFSGTEAWLRSIPEDIRPERDQPFYHLLAEAEQTSESYIAYVSEQNLVRDHSGAPVNNPWPPVRGCAGCGLAGSPQTVYKSNRPTHRNACHEKPP